MQVIEQEKKEILWSVREILNWTTKRFSESGIETPLLDSQLLLSRVLNLSKIQLYIEIDKPLTEKERILFRELVKKRLKGEPVSYLLNEKYWHDIKLFVDNRVLIPRPETETMLDFVLQKCKLKNEKPEVIFDLCTGSGCLAIALAKKYPEAKVVGIDLSKDAIDVCIKNAELNSVSNVTWINADVTNMDLFKMLSLEYKKADIIVSNPPYVTEEEWQKLDAGVKDYEPKMALVCDDNGLKIGKNILQYITDFKLLNKNSIFAMELAEKQPQKIDNNINKIIQINHPMWNMPINEWFALCDYEGKDRFLVRIEQDSKIE
ncbi:peptide chain release factor N(5)-glutamine methyltransferase [Silvanigrella sp.]|jgi:release factor glutamine methyltransferase|uniref:peptide chain release factor N(5)-glutamine methyltransferase n=1 Tax=Silvanigrella sp. TaxID=2024976 RepID=UPI0037C8F0AC|nr:peptide chain release factor N(5)-glutamine methyltransferase [Silvanigrellaceae bacterium]